MGHTQRFNIHRGFMKLEVWNEGMELFRLVSQIIENIPRLDLKLKSQILDSVQSVSANIAEGYCRRTINEYLQFLNIALGSSGEVMTRMIGLSSTNQLSRDAFEEFDRLHFAVENKLIALIRSLQAKRRKGDWEEEFAEVPKPQPR